MARTPLLNAFLQSDLDAKGFKIKNLASTGAEQSGMVYVDPNVATDEGQIGTTIPFKTLESALLATPAGYTIIMRPGTYLYDGILEVSRQHINIFGSNAIISPITAGQTAGLLITGNFAIIDGITFDGGLSGSPSNTGTVIEINMGTNVSLSNLIIRDQQGDAITLTDRYSSISINECTISTCRRAIVGGIVSDSDINGVAIEGNLIQNCRAGGIVIHGNDNTNLVRDIKIEGNDITNCDVDGVNAAGIDTSAGVSDVVITGNYISRCFYGVYVTLSTRVVISANSMFGISDTLIHNDGNKYVTMSSNLLDGSSPSTGNPTCNVGIAMVGFNTIAGNDAGPYVITGNMITGIDSAGEFINTANANDILIEGNQFNAAAVLKALSFNNLKISNNNFNITGVGTVIRLDADTRGWTNCTISDNRFKLSTTTGWSRLIATTDAFATGQSNLTIVGNWSTPFITYSGRLVGNIAGADPTNQFLHSNTPQTSEFDRQAGAPDARKGWVNDYQVSLVADRVNIPTSSPTKYQVGGSQVVGDRITGWTLPSGTQSRNTFDPATVTLAQLGQRVNALIHDLHITTGHGLIGFYS